MSGVLVGFSGSVGFSVFAGSSVFAGVSGSTGVLVLLMSLDSVGEVEASVTLLP